MAPKTSTVIKSRAFYSDSDSSDDATGADATIKEGVLEMDEDHELLLKSCIPLLQSRNSGVRIKRKKEAR